MENNLTSYLRLKKAPIKEEQQEDDFSQNFFQWTPDWTSLLLKLRFNEERHSKFEDRSFQRKELWDEIAAEMNRIIGAHQVSGDVCDLKYRNMLHTYKKNRNKELNGTDPENISWCYYEIFKQALKSSEEKEITNHADDTNDNSQMEESTNNNNNKKKKWSIKPEIMEIPVTPIVELRAPSARLSNKRLHSALAQAAQQSQHSTPLNESDSRIKAVDNEQRNQSRALQTNLSGFELEECRVFGETVGIQLSLIKSPDIRALAELKIQEILYSAKVSKLKE